METSISKPYPNQKLIISGKSTTVENPYIAINEDDFYTAVRNLKPSTVLIWEYLIKNSPDYQLRFSPKAIKNIMDISEKTSKRAIQELEEKGYLINIEDNLYQCLTRPIDGDKITLGTNCPDTRDNKSPILGTNCPINGDKNTRETSNTSNLSMSTSNGDTEVSQDLENSDTDSESVVNNNNIVYNDLDNLSKEKLIELQKDYHNHIPYNELHDKYKVDRKYLNNNLDKEITIRLNRLSVEDTANRNINETYDISDLSDWINTFDEFDIQLYNKQQKKLEQQEQEKKKKKIA